MVSGLEYLDEPRELEHVAALFCGGMELGDHCGFYTGGLIVIGLAAAGYPEGKNAARKARAAFTEAWKKKWPLICREIRAGTPERKAPSCAALGEEAGSLLGPLLEPLAADSRRARFARKTPS